MVSVYELTCEVIVVNKVTLSSERVAKNYECFSVLGLCQFSYCKSFPLSVNPNVVFLMMLD